MKAFAANGTFGIIGLLLFFGIFMAILVWLFWPGRKNKFKDYGRIPLEDDKDHE